jgi:N,N'-diacetyllegionaminate synthase
VLWINKEGVGMLFIAEIGLNHNGNFELACELIKQAKFAGADIAKFQCGWRHAKGEVNHMDLDTLKKLKRWCDYFDIEFMASVFNEEAYGLLKQIKPKRYKIASRTLKDNFNFAEKIVRENKETIVSLGMWEGDRAPFPGSDAKYLWCKSVYPSQPWDLTDMPKDFRSSIYAGYSDHSIGIETVLIAVSRGAVIIEKHFTLDKSSSVGRDHVLSATPEEFALLVNIGKDISKKISMGV